MRCVPLNQRGTHLMRCVPLSQREVHLQVVSNSSQHRVKRSIDTKYRKVAFEMQQTVFSWWWIEWACIYIFRECGVRDQGGCLVGLRFRCVFRCQWWLGDYRCQWGWSCWLNSSKIIYTIHQTWIVEYKHCVEPEHLFNVDYSWRHAFRKLLFNISYSNTDDTTQLQHTTSDYNYYWLTPRPSL